MSYVRLDLVDLAVALFLVAVSILLARLERARYTRDLLVGTFRTILQLLAVGFLLRGVFAIQSLWLNLVVLAVMLLIASANAVRRQEKKLPGYGAIALLSLACGSFSTLLFVLVLVVRPRPWFEAQYLIPLGGMIIAYAMNALTLLRNRFDGEMQSRRNEIEARLALGASARRSAEDVVRTSFRAALLPTINFMMVVGIVQIPGMMGGQIIGGADPFDAALYQILVAFQLLAAASIASFTASRLLLRKAFTTADQIAPIYR